MFRSFLCVVFGVLLAIAVGAVRSSAQAAPTYSLPTVSACGAGASVSGYNGLLYTVTYGTAATSCTLTYPAGSFGAAPLCFSQTSTTLSGIAAISVSGTTAPVLTLSIGTSLLSASAVQIVCFGPPFNS